MKAFVVFLAVSGISFVSQAANLVKPASAETCAACHGANGISANDLWPNLAGQKSKYILKQLQAFQSGERKDPMMSPIVQTLSEQELIALANYYSKLN
ncbi:MAG: cytochrome c [Bdellovibrionaceae bacterium]|nr:cytochrome c [Pseudobdellovibrionaceae bacterium]